jgi:mRNA interferase MazF
VNLDPSIGTEVKKTRPAVILSNNAQNSVGQRVLAAPITSNVSRVYSFEAKLEVGGVRGKAMLDQVRCLDQSRLRGYIGAITSVEMRAVEKALRIAFDLV